MGSVSTCLPAQGSRDPSVGSGAHRASRRRRRYPRPVASDDHHRKSPRSSPASRRRDLPRQRRQAGPEPPHATWVWQRRGARDDVENRDTHQQVARAGGATRSSRHKSGLPQSAAPGMPCCCDPVGYSKAEGPGCACRMGTTTTGPSGELLVRPSDTFDGGQTEFGYDEKAGSHGEPCSRRTTRFDDRHTHISPRTARHKFPRACNPDRTPAPALV